MVRLTAVELGLVLEVAKTAEPQWYALFATLALTGGRWGEVSALRWTDVDLDGGEVVFRRAQSRGVLKELKTDQIRRVPIVPMLAETCAVTDSDYSKSRTKGAWPPGSCFLPTRDPCCATEEAWAGAAVAQIARMVSQSSGDRSGDAQIALDAQDGKSKNPDTLRA